MKLIDFRIIGVALLLALMISAGYVAGNLTQN